MACSYCAILYNGAAIDVPIGIYMLLIPAIDLKDQACVRLRQGRMQDVTVFSTDPVAMATRWVQAGASRLHLVDLDGAVAGAPKNADCILAIRRALPALKLQVGGGIRDLATVEQYLAAGVDTVIVGTVAAQDPTAIESLCRQAPGKIMVGLDARDGRVATDGWEHDSGLDITELAKQFADSGVCALIYTDIARDGMMRGANWQATGALARAVPIPIIASGGVSTLADIEQLWRIDNPPLYGAIIGRALYEGTIDLSLANRSLAQWQRAQPESAPAC